MNVLDAVIGYVSPVSGLRRAQARAAMAGLSGVVESVRRAAAGREGTLANFLPSRINPYAGQRDGDRQGGYPGSARHRVWSGWKTTVEHTPADCKGDEYTCPRYGQISKEKRPEWWPTGMLPGAEWFSVTELHEGNTPHPHGMNYVISEPDGLVFAERWRS